jgi:transcriptional regulator with XRE-family HTH domain
MEQKRCSPEKLAKLSKVRKQSILLWEKKGKIPENRLKQISTILEVPEKYLTKEITEIDKLELEKLIMEKILDDSIQKAKIPVYDDSGNLLSETQETMQYGILNIISVYDEKISKLKLLDSIKDCIEKSESNYSVFNTLNEIIRSNSINTGTLVQVMDALKSA